jgi:hypothetical protein
LRLFAWSPAGFDTGRKIHASMFQNCGWDGEPLMGAASIRDAESVLAAFPGLADFTVVEHGTAPDDRCLVAYVVPSNPDLDVTALHAHARSRLPGPLAPAAIVILDELPMAADGTVDLAELPEPDLNGLLPYRAPESPRQETLCTLFAEILGVARCGMDSDFFQLRGRSVDAVLLAGRISIELGARVSMADLFRAPTPADLDRRLDVRRPGGITRKQVNDDTVSA